MLKIPELKVLVAYTCKTCQECTVKYSTMHLVRQYKHRKNTSCIKLLMCNKSLLIDMFVHWCIWKNCRRKKTTIQCELFSTTTSVKKQYVCLIKISTM